MSATSRSEGSARIHRLADRSRASADDAGVRRSVASINAWVRRVAWEEASLSCDTAISVWVRAMRCNR